MARTYPVSDENE